MKSKATERSKGYPWPEIERLIYCGRDNRPADIADITALLAGDADSDAALFRAADRLRKQTMGDAVYLRGIIEFSNYCRRNCYYCGIRSGMPGISRYRMKPDEIIDCAVRVWDQGCTTVVLQSGEDPWFTVERLEMIVRGIKLRTGAAVTLSIGERSKEAYRRLRIAGADRYLLRFETSDRSLFCRLHPDGNYDRRLQCLTWIRAAGFQVGTGFLIGLPFSDMGVLARDIMFTTALQPDMIGCGPFIAHPDTPLAGHALWPDDGVYFRVPALLRLLNPWAHIPATTAYDAIRSDGRDRVLQCGANVFMPNMTPGLYRRQYQLYPGKPCIDEPDTKCAVCVRGRLARLGRSVGRDAGHARVRDVEAIGR